MTAAPDRLQRARHQLAYLGGLFSHENVFLAEVDEIVQGYLWSPYSGGDELLIQMLDGSWNGRVSRRAWQSLFHGVESPRANDSDGRPLQQCVVQVLLSRGIGSLLPRVIKLRETAAADPVLRPWMSDDKTLLRHLCSTDAIRRAADGDDALPRSASVLNLALSEGVAEQDREHVLQVTWATGGYRMALAAIAEMDDEDGAVVREFLMRQALEGAAASSAVTSDTVAPPARFARAHL